MTPFGHPLRGEAHRFCFYNCFFFFINKKKTGCCFCLFLFYKKQKQTKTIKKKTKQKQPSLFSLICPAVLFLPLQRLDMYLIKLQNHQHIE